MPYTPTRLYLGQPGTGATTLHTAGAQGTIVKEVILANTAASDATVTLGVNGTAAANQIVPGMTIKAKETVVLALSLVLNNTDTLQALQGTASAITVTVSGEVKS